MDAILNANGKPVLQRIVRGIQENKAYLSEVDGLIGDGDHGMNMNKGFTVFGERIAERDVTLSEGLEELGMVLLNEIGGSMGPIYGTIFMEMADVSMDAEQIDLPMLEKMLRSGLTALYDVVEARVGDKTLVDTLSPAVDALTRAIAQGDSFAQALRALREAAEQGRDSTKELVARFGRSSRLGERSRGVLDAGATSCCIILQNLADGILEQL